MTKYSDFSLSEQVELMRLSGEDVASDVTETTTSDCIPGFEAWHEKYSRIICHFAGKYSCLCCGTFSREDLVQEAWRILIYTLHNTYTPGKAKFSTYLSHWLDNELRSFANGNRAGLHISSSDMKNISKVKKALKTFHSTTDEEPTIEELAELSGLKVSDVRFCLRADQASTNITSLNTAIWTDEDSTELLHLIRDSRALIESIIEYSDGRARLHSLIDRELDSREADAVKFMYGFVDGQKHTNAEVADYICAGSRQRASQILKEALKKLRRALDGPYAA